MDDVAVWEGIAGKCRIRPERHRPDSRADALGYCAALHNTTYSTRRRRNQGGVNTQHGHARPRLPEPIGNCSRATVLVIDDDAWIRSVIAEFLTAADFGVEQAADGASGLLLAEQVQPDVILLDLALPIRSGLEVLQ